MCWIERADCDGALGVSVIEQVQLCLSTPPPAVLKHELK